jgi:hypothetical protein
MATRKRKTKTMLGRKSSKRFKTMNRLNQAQKAALRAMSAARGAHIGQTAVSTKQNAALRAMSAARGALASRTSASTKQRAALRRGGFMFQR